MIINSVLKPQFRTTNGVLVEIEGKQYENIRLFGSQGTQTNNQIGNLLGNLKDEIIIKEYYDIKQEEIEVLEQIKRLQSEKQSKCKNIIKILGIKDNRSNQQSKYEPKIYVALEKGKGDVLALIKQNTQLPYMTKLNLFLQMVQGVQELHDLGYFHRDVKPENFVYFINQNQEYQIKLIDFGIVKRTDTINQTPQVGTFNYMAPEVVLSEGNYDKTADIWSLGITFYYILTLEEFLQAKNATALRKYLVDLNQKQIDQILDNSTGIEQLDKQLLSCMLQQNKSFRIGLQELINKINFRIKTFQYENTPNKDQKKSQQNIQFQKFQQNVKPNFCLFQNNKINESQFSIKTKQQVDDDPKKLPNLQVIIQTQSNQQDCQQQMQLLTLYTKLQPIFMQFQKDIRSMKIECESNKFFSQMKEQTVQLQETLSEQKKTLQFDFHTFCENQNLFKERIMAIENKKWGYKNQIKDLLVQQQKVSQKAGGELELLINSVNEKSKEIKFTPMDTKLMETYENLQKQDLELQEEIIQINSMMTNYQLNPSQLNPSQLNQLKVQIQKVICKLDDLMKKLPSDYEIQEFNKQFKSNLDSYYIQYALVNYIKQFHITKYYERIRVYHKKQKKQNMNQSDYQRKFNQKQQQESEFNAIKEKEAQDLLQRYKNILFKDQTRMKIIEMEKDQQQMDKIVVELERYIKQIFSVKLKSTIKNQQTIKMIISEEGIYKIKQFAFNLIFKIMLTSQQ
ncbi:unnamed protein product (macronuclear) [Paramecium tetraurelia]|uniref:Protein kinase domain-containing protein n=1 Tax=Paramecium tetraurelia TaxID=5888 RepID=A0E2G3_PARTE|nr:uncharacterized protein GSPATT00022652001 [Paramecium tetraurelia]CAK89480.1 unnamed protein product [Paramecium tetraurelia]|eukprot:XP_001456877.1 hypothetical protein (macronuclear) [Paramecium tetraurelia strain d4-2]